MINTFQALGLFKFTEEDNWKDGCQPKTGSSYMIDYDFHGKTAEEVVNKIANFLGVDKDAIELDSCGEDGRVDFALEENSDGNQLSKQEIAQWKKGKIKAFYAIYTARVEEVKPVKLTKGESS